MSATAFDDMVVLQDTTALGSPIETSLAATPRRLVPSYGRPSKLRMYAPLTVLLVVQTLLSLRRGGVALAVESASLARQHTLLSPVTSRLLGDPAIYPRLARALVSLGGLGLLRAASLVLMLGTTLLVFSLGRHLFGDLAGVLAGVVFGVSAPVLALGHLGVPDSLALMLLATGVRLAFAGHRPVALRRAAAAPVTTFAGSAAQRLVPAALGGAMCGASAVTSFAAVAVLPAAVLLVLAGWRHEGASRGASARTTWALGSIFAVGVVVTMSGFAAAMSLLPHALSAPLEALTGGALPLATIAARLIESLAPEIVLAVAAAAIVVFSRPRRQNLILSTVLFAALPLVIGYQLASGTSSSLLENEGYAMVFIAPLIGAGLMRVVRRGGSRAVMPLLAVLAIVLAFSAANFLRDLAWSASVSNHPVPLVNTSVRADRTTAH